MNKAEKSLRWVVNQIPDFKPTTNEEEMLVAIKLYSEAGAEEIKRLKAENAALRERLENAIEVPFVFNKKVFVIVYDQKENPHLFEGIVTGIGTDTNKLYEGEIDLLMSVVDECGETHFINGKQYRKQWFCEDEIEYVEARLAELKGEENDG